MIKDNIRRLRDDISSVCQGVGRDPEEISLIAVTKNVPSPRIKEAIETGITDLGENRIQEAQSKSADFKDDLRIKWHLVGHLQTNKIKPALDIFQLIHSVDSINLAEQIDKAAAGLGKKIAVLLQVNTSGEETKYGIKQEALPSLLEATVRLEHLQVKGLMTIAPLTEDQEIIREAFRDLRLLKEAIVRENHFPAVKMEYLSMGMTNDYRIAIEEGSNMLRIGRAIFGTQMNKD